MNDFSSFHFAESQPSREAGLVESDPPDARMSVPDDARVSVPALDSVFDSAAKDVRVTELPDSSTVPQGVPDTGHPAGVDAAAEDDAQIPPDTLECTRDWSATSSDTPVCRDCACDRCSSSALDCLSRGSVQERALCTALFGCALRHACHDWDCYCSTSKCYTTTTAPGDGPCVSEMNAAAGGQHDRVSAVHRENDPSQPLVKAVRAIGCSIGVPLGSVGGSMTGKCVAACGP
jgi:hypothetical protein